MSVHHNSPISTAREDREACYREAPADRQSGGSRPAEIEHLLVAYGMGRSKTGDDTKEHPGGSIASAKIEGPGLADRGKRIEPQSHEKEQARVSPFKRHRNAERNSNLSQRRTAMGISAPETLEGTPVLLRPT
jgi:hypothetical protein